MTRMLLFGSGLAAAVLLPALTVAQTTFQPNSDRRADGDYWEFTMQRPSAQLCLDACLNSAPCRSWTYVPKHEGGAVCRLGKEKRQAIADPCCTSGTR